MSTTSYNQAIEDAAKWHDDTATLAAENDDIRDAEIHRICARAIRALRQPASDTPDPRDEVIRELADDLEAEIRDRYGASINDPLMQRKFKRDMDLVNRARALMAREGQL